MLAGSGLAIAGLWPGEGWGKVVFTTIEGVLPGDEGCDFLAWEKVSHDEVTFGREEFAFAFEGAQVEWEVGLCFSGYRPSSVLAAATRSPSLSRSEAAPRAMSGLPPPLPPAMGPRFLMRLPAP